MHVLEVRRGENKREQNVLLSYLTCSIYVISPKLFVKNMHYLNSLNLNNNNIKRKDQE